MQSTERGILVATLKGDLDNMRFAGFWPSHVETGPLVWELLVDWCIFGRRFPANDPAEEEARAAKDERMRKELMLGLTDMTFNEMPVRLFSDVPDGRFWPAREAGGYIIKPFAGTEAHDAFKPV
jgi:hypothetical protein